MNIITYIYLVLITSIVLISCSEIEDNITSVSNPGFHGAGVMDKNSPNFHGNYFDKLKFRDCQSCHAKNFQGSFKNY